MIFPASIFLYLLPLAGLPVLFHFILKQKKRTVIFSTLMFFHRTDPRLNSHRKIRQWLLLLMRILLIAFILLALSRPKFVTSAGLGGNIAVVAIVDNSGSMSATADCDNDKTKLQCAVDSARKLISTLQRGCEAAVVLLVDDLAIEGGTPLRGPQDALWRNPADSLTSDKEFLLACLDKVRPTQATGNAYRALTRAFKLLHTSSAGSGAVHVFSDLQQAEWAPLDTRYWMLDARREQDESRIENRGSRIETVYFHKIKPQIRREANVAITAVQFPQERILPKHPYTVGLVLQNNSEITADIRVNSIDSHSRKNTENVVLAGGNTKAVELEVKLDEAGYHWIKTWIEGDGFSADNEAGIGILCEETAAVLFAGASPLESATEEFGVLPVALSPSGQGQFTGMVVEFCLQKQLNKTVAEKKPILIVTTWNGMQSDRESSAWLQEYVEQGGNLLIVPSAMPVQRIFSEQLPGDPKREIGRLGTPDWLGVGIRQREAYPRGVKLEVLDNATNFWQRIREATSGLQLEPVSLYILHPLELTGEFTPLLGVDPAPDRGGVVIAHRRLGKGNIYASGIAFASHWNTLPSTGLLVVMAQRMAASGSSSQEEQVLSIVAGDYPRGIKAQGGQVEILSLVGDPIDWKGNEQEGSRPAGSQIPVFPKAGVYLIKTSNNKYCISVRASEKEGLDEFVEGSKVPVMGRITHKILPYNEEEDFGQYHKGQARAIELYLPLLLLATLALLVEGWLGAPSSLVHRPSSVVRGGTRDEARGTYSRRAS